MTWCADGSNDVICYTGLFSLLQQKPAHTQPARSRAMISAQILVSWFLELHVSNVPHSLAWSTPLPTIGDVINNPILRSSPQPYVRQPYQSPFYTFSPKDKGVVLLSCGWFFITLILLAVR